MFADKERVFVRAMGGTSVLHHPKPTGTNLFGNALVQDDHAVRNIFFQTIPCNRSLALLTCNDRRHAAIF